jgi:hypothetical protein
MKTTYKATVAVVGTVALALSAFVSSAANAAPIDI